ncbi:DNA cytosine methyltransferase [Hellea balneolensis]|uniref:DNA cytosine methyltransferase n=1 Tax=Hellea balneolensis TaxID=287478 RepID=UPI0004248A95|nr:DNA cytosine methyltransferase [Hellea balneolensis]
MTKKFNESFSVFSFFSGGGFLDLGFESEEFDVVFANEIHTPFLEAYSHSRDILGIREPKYGLSNVDITSLRGDRGLAEAVKMEENLKKVIGFIGGPPCPDFSVGGKNRGRSGENGRLSETYVDLIINGKPHFFLFENVKGLYRTKKHREFFEHLKDKLCQFYYLSERVVNALEYGVPQDRERIILVGFRRDCFEETKFGWGERLYPDRSGFQYDWPDVTPFYPRKLVPRPDHLPLGLTVQYWFDRNDVKNHPNSKHHFKPRAGLPRFKTICEGDDKKKSYKRLHRWRYSPTAAYGNNEVHLHPYKARRLSAAEALAIQSLPKEYEFPADMGLSNMFKCIGNGVPYLAAKGLAASIKLHIIENYQTNLQQFNEFSTSSAA